MVNRFKGEIKEVPAFAHVKSNRGTYSLESYYFVESVVLRNKCEQSKH